MKLTRKQVIKELEDYYSYITGSGNINIFTEALEYAISSLKTDEAYQLMYEGEEIFTNDEVIALLEVLKQRIEDIPSDGYYVRRDRVLYQIQEKINALKGE